MSALPTTFTSATNAPDFIVFFRELEDPDMQNSTVKFLQFHGSIIQILSSPFKIEGISVMCVVLWDS